MKIAASVATLFFAVASVRAGGPPCAPEFLYPTLYPQLGSVQSITVEDVNGDGRPDLVLDIYSDTDGIGVRLGQPDGTFGPPILSSTSWRPVSLAIGEFDQGAPPGIVLGIEQAELSYHAGNGDGTFAPGVPIAPRGLGLIPPVDVNGDGKLDVVGAFSGGFAVHLGNGDGTFQAAIDTLSEEYVGGLAIGDVTGDGQQDAVIGGFEGDVLVFPGLGNGSFDSPSAFPVGEGVGKIELAALDANGSLDIVASSEGDVVVLLNNGDGTFQAGVVYDEGIPALLGDFDGDGEVDVAAFREGALTILRGLGDGSFAAGGSFLVPFPYAASDLDDDGDLDLVAGAMANSFASFTVVAGNGDGTFRTPRLTRSDLDPTYGVRGATGDFDEDGLPDIAFGEDTVLTIYRNAGFGSFERGARYSTGFAALAAADFDGDSHVDLATAVLDEVTILKGAGDGTFTPGPPIPAGPPGSFPNAMISGDFDGDGFADLAIGDWVDAQGALVILRGHGDGQFDVTSIALPVRAMNLATADLRGLGRSDIGVTLFRDRDSLAIFLAGADGTFSGPSYYEAGAFPESLVFGDFHQTGHPDALAGRPGDATLAWLPSLGGSGAFGDPTILSAGASMSFLATADFDLDGLTDLAISGFPLAVLHGAPGGGFQAPQLYPGLFGQIFADDYDGNGFADVAFLGPQIFESGIGVLLSGRIGVTVPGVSAVVGTAAGLQAYAGGFGPLTYQWRKDGVDLSDGGPISGATTATLTIDPVAFADAGSYDVVVTDACGSVTSNAATLAVEFADVPLSSPFHDDILTIAIEGITGGCGSGNYCPASPVRRDQMAVFLLKSEHGSDYTPPPCTGVFDDVPCPGPFTDWVEQLAAEGVTGGCGIDIYCPAQSVTRAQMAVFLLKTKEGSGYVPPPATGIFGDVPVGSFAADFIEQLYDLGITGGCSASPLLYCPGSAVLRQQMATFLVRTFLP